jgi:hypothetical protein
LFLSGVAEIRELMFLSGVAEIRELAVRGRFGGFMGSVI